MKMARCSLWCFLVLTALDGLSAATVHPLGRTARRGDADGAGGGGGGGAGSRRSGRSVHPAPVVDLEQDRKNRVLLNTLTANSRITVHAFEKLIAQGADPCAVVKDELSTGKIAKSTCFNRAAASGNLDVVRWFIKNYPDRINDQMGDLRRWAPLFWAANRGHVHLVEALLAAGADPTLVDYSGCLAVNYTQNPEIRERLMHATAGKSAQEENLVSPDVCIGDPIGSTSQPMPVGPAKPTQDVIITQGSTAPAAQPPSLPPQPPRIPRVAQREVLPDPTGPVVGERIAVAVEPEAGNGGADDAARAVALQTVTQALRAAIGNMIDGMARGVRSLRDNCVIL